MTFDGFPLIIGWELTLKCNLQCRHCGSSAGFARRDELSIDEALGICSQMPDLMVQEVNFTGGEPLLCSYWEELAIGLRNLRISTKVLTNGVVVDESLVMRMKKVGIAGVGFSIDGLESTHDHIRNQKGVFSSAVEGIELVVENKLPVTVITTVNSLNIVELPEVHQTLHSLGVSRWQVQPVFPLGRVTEDQSLRLSEDEYLRFGEFVNTLELKPDADGMEVSPSDSYGYYTELDSREPPWGGCPAGLFSCGITSDGKVKGCLSLPDHLVEGDLRRNDLWDIWFDEDSFKYTRKFSKEQLGPNCKQCDEWQLCKGGCSAMSYGSTGIFHNDPYCFHGIRMRQG